MSRLYYAWTQIKENPRTNSKLKISVVIAIRNESKNLAALLDSLLKQEYSFNLFEIIFIDDHSEDNSEEIILKFQAKNPDINISYTKLEENFTGKKAALRKAYQLVKNDIILTSDGDTIVPPQWIKLTAEAFEQKEIKMLLGGVKILEQDSFVGSFQALELLSLIGSGAGAAKLKHPMMSNGANLAFRKEVLKKIDTEKLQANTASGDDMFLMLEVKRVFGSASILFLKNEEHFVSTPAVRTWKELLEQRIRWVSKSSHYQDNFLLASSWIVFLQNLALVMILFASFFYTPLIHTLIYIWILKALIDFAFLQNICKFSSQMKLLKLYPLMALIYPFFISYTAIIGQFASFSWKGRKY